MAQDSLVPAKGTVIIISLGGGIRLGEKRLGLPQSRWLASFEVLAFALLQTLTLLCSNLHTAKGLINDQDVTLLKLD